MNGYIVGLCGHAGAGKDEVARIVAELRSDWVVRRDAFADRLKISAARALGFYYSDEESIKAMNDLKINGNVACSWSTGSLTISGRTFMQLYGTESHRDVFGENFWVDHVLPNPELAFFGRDDAFDMLVVTDVRFPNEVERVRACGGMVWLVDRPSVAPKDDNHRSTIIPDHDVVVDNSGDLDDLRDTVQTALIVGLR